MARPPLPQAKASAKDEPVSAPAPAPAKESTPEPTADAKDEPPQPVAEAKGDAEARPKRMGRPTTARRRPPKQKDNVTAVASNEPKAAPVKGIVMDGDEDDDEEEEEEMKGDADLDAKFAPITQSGPKSKLVQDIEAEQKADAEAQAKARDSKGGADAKDGGGGIRLGRLKKSSKEKKGTYGFTESEITELRRSIQVLCQATNPLGKCMDHVHDDMEMMNKELEQWKAEYRRNVELMEEESKSTEESLQPLNMQLMEVDQQVEEMVKKINAVQANISKNDARVAQLLRMVVHV